MNRILITIAIAAIGIGVLILGLACSPSPQNANQSQNAANEGHVHPAAEIASDESACKTKDPNDPQAAAKAVKGRIEDKIKTDDELWKMYNGVPPYPPAFKVATYEYKDSDSEDYVVIFIEGAINQDKG